MCKKLTFAVLLSTTAAAVSLGAEPQMLGAAEVRDLIVGKTIETQNANGSKFRVYFDPDGQRYAQQPEGEYALPWRILADGTHCVTTGTGDDCARVRRNADGTWSRMRDGDAVTHWVQILPGKALIAPAAGIYVRQLEATRYELTLVNPTTLEEAQAQARIAAAAAAVCRDLMPVPGKFRYQAVEPIGSDTPQRASDAFRFTQEVACMPRTATTETAERRPTLQSPAESQRVQEDVRKLSEAYFAHLAAGRFDAALAQISLAGMGVSPETWKEAKRAFQTLAGEPMAITIHQLTVYDNPAAAPAPGLYVAADFSNAYRNVPMQCGYLMWFRPPGGQFHITREETGHLTAEQLQAIPAAQLTEVKRKLRCPAP